jgi:cytoskeletal protein CcmA (bactofilin family)
MLNKWLGGGTEKKTTGTTKASATLPQHAHLKPSIIADGVLVEGDVKTEAGILHVDGSIHGNVKVTSLTIGPTGLLDGSIEASSVTVRGVFIGNLLCDDLVIDSTARVSGHLHYRTLAIGGGAIVDGVLVRRAGHVAPTG